MNEWFTIDGVNMQWIDEGSRVSSCDVCLATVLLTERRLRVDNGKGPERKSGRGKRHQYLCERCAEKVIA